MRYQENQENQNFSTNWLKQTDIRNFGTVTTPFKRTGVHIQSVACPWGLLVKNPVKTVHEQLAVQTRFISWCGHKAQGLTVSSIICYIWVMPLRRFINYSFFCTLNTHNKLTLHGTGGQLLVTANFKVTWNKNWNKNQKSSPDKLYVLCPNLRIRGHLPAPIINGGDSLWKWLNCRLSSARDLDLDHRSGHTAYHHASSTFTYITNFIEIEETFRAWTDVVQMGRWTFETHFIRSTRRSRPKNIIMATHSDQVGIFTATHSQLWSHIE